MAAEDIGFVSAESVVALEDMGISREQALAAITSTKGDVAAALDRVIPECDGEAGEGSKQDGGSLSAMSSKQGGRASDFLCSSDECGCAAQEAKEASWG